MIHDDDAPMCDCGSGLPATKEYSDQTALCSICRETVRVLVLSILRELLAAPKPEQ